MSDFFKKTIKTLYDIFPIFKRPMAVCASISCAAVYCLYLNMSVSPSLLILFCIFSIVICAISKNRRIIIILILFLLISASAVNEFMLIDELETLDGKEINADFVATQDSEKSGIVSHVTAYSYNSEEIPENTKFILHYYFETEIKCGEIFNADVKLTKLENNKYKAIKLGNSVYMNCRLKRINYLYDKERFFSLIGGIRTYINETINNYYSKDDSSTLIALNTGNTNYLDDNFYDKILTCGVSHIMVVSGLHISIIVGSLFLLLEKFFYNRYLKAILSLLLIFLLCALCGFTLSVLRAGCMFIFTAISPVFMRKNDSLNSLGSAVVLLVFISPLSILSVAFWLSVLSTAAVVWIAPFYSNLIIKKLRINNGLIKTFISVIVVSVSAMVFTAPISLAIFGYVSLLSPLTFLLLTYPVTFALVSNSIGLLLSSVKGLSFVFLPLFYIAKFCAKYIRYVIEFFGKFEFMCIKASVWSFLLFVFLEIVLVIAMCLYKFYIKLLRRNFIKEVYARARNNRKHIKNSALKR